MESTFRLTTLGALELTDPAGRPVESLGARRLTFLALIVAHGERGIPRRVLASLFWPESDELRSRTAFNQAVYVLRQTLGEHALILDGADVMASPSVVSSDIGDFARARAASNHALMAALYGGQFLEGVTPAGVELARHVADIRCDVEADYRDALRRLNESSRPMPALRPNAAPRSRRLGATIFSGLALLTLGLWFARRSAGEPREFDTIGEQALTRMTAARDAYVRAAGDTMRIGRVVLLTPEYEASESYFARLDKQMRFAMAQSFTKMVPADTIQRLEQGARATRMPTSTALQIADVMLKATAPLAIRTVVLARGDSLVMPVSFWHAYVPRDASVTLDSLFTLARTSRLSTRDAALVQVESWSPPAPHYARRDSLKAMVETAQRIERAVRAMETCNGEGAELESWCWKTPTRLVASPHRRPLLIARAKRE